MVVDMPKSVSTPKHRGSVVSAICMPLDLRAAEPGQPTEGDAPRQASFSGTLYSGGEFRQYWSERVVIDLSGMKIEAGRKYGLLKDHGYTYEGSPRLGFFNAKNDGKSLTIEGQMLDSNENARQLVADAKAGFPFELSIGAESIRTEYVDAGAKVNVNGRDFLGPISVVRQSVLREGSIVELGADANTSVRIAAARKGNNMPQINAEMVDVNDITYEWLMQNKPEALKSMTEESDDTEAMGEGAKPVEDTKAASVSALEDIYAGLSDPDRLVIAALKSGMTASAAQAQAQKLLRDELVRPLWDAGCLRRADRDGLRRRGMATQPPRCTAHRSLKRSFP
jgi:hypothetical protein